MAKYRKRPVVVEAFRISKHQPNESDMPTWMAKAFESGELKLNDQGCGIDIKTLEGTMLGAWGDWLIRGVKNELYPCKPDIFQATYEPVEDQAAADAKPIQAIYWRSVKASHPCVPYRALDGVHVEANMGEGGGDQNWLATRYSVADIDAIPAYYRCNQDGTWLSDIEEDDGIRIDPNCPLPFLVQKMAQDEFHQLLQLVNGQQFIFSRLDIDPKYEWITIYGDGNDDHKGSFFAVDIRSDAIIVADRGVAIRVDQIAWIAHGQS